MVETSRQLVTLLVTVLVVAHRNKSWENAPLALVVLEARFPPVGGPLRPPVFRAIRDAVSPNWVIEGAKHQIVQFGLGAGGVVAPSVQTEDVSRITTRDRTSTVTVRAESVTVETTRYSGYESFRELLGTTLGSVQHVLQPDGVVRLGMRYVNEVRVPDGPSPNRWIGWITNSLLAPAVTGLEPSTWASAVQYNLDGGRILALRYGPTDGPVVDPSGPVRRVPPPAPGPVFLLDFDSYWQPFDIPAFAADTLLTTCDLLRDPVRRLLDGLVTDRLVNEVFRGRNDHDEH